VTSTLGREVRRAMRCCQRKKTGTEKGKTRGGGVDWLAGVKRGRPEGGGG